MKINRFFRIASLSLVFSSSAILAQNYQTMPISSGYNADVIANGVGPSTVSTSIDVDGVDFAFVATDFQLTSTSTPITYGIPVNGTIVSAVASTPGLSYQLGSLSANNSLRLATIGQSGTFTFSTPQPAFKLYMLSTSGSGTSNVDVTVTFTDNTTQVFANQALLDWYGGVNFAIQGIGRITRSTGVLEPNTTNPRLYQSLLTIDAANYAKPIQSITVTKVGTSTGVSNIFAFSADVYSTCAAPTLQPVGTLTPNSAQVSWTVPAGTTASTYDIYYSTTNTAPTSATAPTIPGFNGTSTTLGSLLANTTYYYWVRSNCSGSISQSVWSFSGTFKTLCGPVTSMAENFDSYTTGSIVPDCWVRNAGTGSMTISATSPASGTRNIYQYVVSTGTASTVVLPQFSNINAGTHWLRLKAKVSPATGALKVGYVTNPTDPSTFVLLQTLNLTNTTYTNSEYTVIVPNTVPATARLAVQNTADGKSYYWDDVYWEQIPSCFVPTIVTSANIASFSATIGWTAPSPVPTNGYEVYYSTSNVDPTASTVLNSTNSTTSTTTSAPISGLTSNTTYYVWVRSVCSSTDKSLWTSVISFKTLCASVVPVYTNDFSTVPGSCWENALSGGTLASGPTGTSAYWVADGFLNNGTTGAIRMELYNNTRIGWLKTVPFNLSGGTYKVKFDYGVTSFSGTAASAMGSDDVVQFLISNDGGTTWIVLQTWDVNNTPSNSLNAYSLNLPTYTNPNTVFAFYGNEGTVNDTPDYNFYVDNFTVEQANLSTSDLETKKKISIHPNPFKDVIYISETKDIKSVMIYDVAGRIVKLVDDASQEIHVSELKEGMYLVKVNFKDGTQSVSKAIKK